MKRFYTPCVLLIILSSLLLSAHTQANGVENEPPDPATWMPDANLRKAVRAALRLNANEPLTQEKMLNLHGLNAPKLGIRDLTGLEYAMYLKSLSIGGNQIRNLKPLANLGNLRRLYIGGNRIRHIRHLANLTNLRRLGMLRNQVTDISVLAGLVNLKYLRIEGNPITDTSPLRSLPKLIDVDVYISSPPQQENPQPQGESTHFDTDPPEDDGQQTDDRRQDDSSQSQQQQPTTNPQPKSDQQQQPITNPQPQQQQQPSTIPPPELVVLPPEPEPEPLLSLPQQQLNEEKDESEEEEEDEEEDEEEEEEEKDYEAECLAQGGTWYDGVCVRRPTPQEFCEALGGTWDDETETCDGVEGLAPSHPKNAFLLDRITLEQLDPATLEAQLGIWLVENDGSALYLRSIALLESVLATKRPDKTHLLPNYPNPFNPETWIPYHLATLSDVQITIYDTRGTVVRHLDLGHQQAGYYTSRSRAVYWDGCNDIGEKVSSGVYFYQLQTDKTSQLRKMVILK